MAKLIITGSEKILLTIQKENRLRVSKYDLEMDFTPDEKAEKQQKKTQNATEKETDKKAESKSNKKRSNDNITLIFQR